MEKTFAIRVVGDVTLSVGDIWPDGDAPEDPSAEDVHERMADYGSLGEVLRDWNIEHCFSFDVGADAQAAPDALRAAELERDEACAKLEAVRELVTPRPGHPGPVLNSDAIVCELRCLLGEKGGE